MRTSIIVTTYNRPDALRLVLQSIFHQSRLPDEIVIADDGSGEDTRKLILSLSRQSPVPMIHAWQEDLGFRASRARNLAASKAQGDYLVFIDGDMVLHRKFVYSHLRVARNNWLLHGKRAMLRNRKTQRTLNKNLARISPFSPGIALRRYAWHSDLLSGLLSHPSGNWFDTQSANLSLWKKDLIAVNGFNEDFVGWGREDSELALRLSRHGVRKLEIRFSAIAFHLAHGKDNKHKDPESAVRNQDILDQTLQSGLIRCANGIDKHL